MFAIFLPEVLIARERSEYGVGRSNELVRGLKLVDKRNRRLCAFCKYAEFVIIGMLSVYDVPRR